MTNTTAPVFASTTVKIEGIGDVTITTLDFTTPGYLCDGFETVTTMPDGQQFGCGPDNGETPAELHAMLSDPEVVARGIGEVWSRSERAAARANAGKNPFGTCESGHEYFRGGCPDCGYDMMLAG